MPAQFCPHCGQLVIYPMTEAGKRKPCSKCNQPFYHPASVFQSEPEENAGTETDESQAN
jgi:DNA-directed RNA polymerase subunit M/transcription elongation factor TFIIS